MLFGRFEAKKSCLRDYLTFSKQNSLHVKNSQKKRTEIHQNYSSSASNSASRSLTGTAAAQPLLPEAGRQPRLSPSPSAPVLNTKSHFRTSSDTTKIGRWWRQIFELTHCSKLEISTKKSFWLRKFLVCFFEGSKLEEMMTWKFFFEVLKETILSKKNL